MTNHPHIMDVRDPDLFVVGSKFVTGPAYGEPAQEWRVLEITGHTLRCEHLGDADFLGLER